MAERRMFAKSIIDSDVFLDMPLSTQALYFHLAMRADDDGFINNPKKIMRMVGASQNEIDLLLAKRYILGFNSGVIVIKHWRIHNYIRGDRYKETLYVEEKELVTVKGNKSYTECHTAGLPDVIPSDIPTVDPGKVRLGKVSKGKSNTCAPDGGAYTPDFETWWEAYPKKRSKDRAFKAWKKASSRMPPLQEHIQIIKAWSRTDGWAKEGGQYVPYPEKWINSAGWHDELPGHVESSPFERPKIGTCIECRSRDVEIVNGYCEVCRGTKRAS